MAAVVKGKQKQSKQSGSFDNTNRFVLWPNDKGDNENRPDYTGTITVKPEDFKLDGDGNYTLRMAAWVKAGDPKKGGDFLSGQVSQPEAKD